MTEEITKGFLNDKIKEAEQATDYPEAPAWLKHVQCKGQPSGRLTCTEAHLMVTLIFVDENEPADGESAEQEKWLGLRNQIEATFTTRVGKRVYLGGNDEFMVGPEFSLYVTLGKASAHPFPRFCDDMASY